MTVHVSTNANDPGPWASTAAVGWDPGEMSPAQRFYLNDSVSSADPRRSLRVRVPASPVAEIDEDAIRRIALQSARKRCDDPEVVGIRWLRADEIAADLRAAGLIVAEVELRGTPRA
jgi:hypothetical protein